MVVYLLTTLIFLNLIASSVYLLLKGLLFWAKDRIDERFRYIGCIAVMLLFLIPFYQVLPVPSAYNTSTFDENRQEEISVIIPTESFQAQKNFTNETNEIRHKNLHLDLWMQKSILTIWAVGSAVLALWHLSTLLVFRWRLSKRQTEPVSIELQQMANLCAKEYGLRQMPSLRVLPDVQGPMLIGFIKPIIVVPANNLPLADASMILKHEIVHFKRHDLWWKLLGVIIQTVHWFNPIVWLLCKDFEFCAETSCDAEVVKNFDHDERKRYGYLLISYVQLQQTLRSVPGVSFTPAQNKLKRRITVMLKGNKSQKVIAVALICMLAVSSLAVSAFAANHANQIENAELTKVTPMNDSNIKRVQDVKIGASGVVTAVDDLNMLNDRGVYALEDLAAMDSRSCTSEEITADFAPYATNSVNSNIKANTLGVFNPSFSMEAGETVTISCSYSPMDAKVDYGLLDANGNFYYVNTSNGSMTGTFKINVRGQYRLAICNNSGSPIAVTGFVKY